MKYRIRIIIFVLLCSIAFAGCPAGALLLEAGEIEALTLRGVAIAETEEVGLSLARIFSFNAADRGVIGLATRTIVPELTELQGVFELRALRVSVARNANPKLFLTRNGKTRFFGEIEPKGIINVLGDRRIRINTSIYTTRLEPTNVYTSSNPTKIISRIEESGKLILKLGEIPGGMYRVYIPADETIGLIDVSNLLLLTAASGVISDHRFVICDNCDGQGVEACPVCHIKKIYKCPACYGKKLVKCNYCVDGFIACVVCQGKGNHSCPGCNGNLKTVCQYCNMNAENICISCEGIGWLVCKNCFSSGLIKCRKCNGLKYVIQ